ncbi:hypothetical protein BC937DRAFT_89188 [Endogone sp. FLAS-F59071]|nr:hypothetical protein BC937DRAFT_89188 [Endogone sp. FLAS-F59071]|eukprot:RUS18058.1 hypothetical protein BC937DRAFT_89188 [Endogone sp. FLAS-F59071]
MESSKSNPIQTFHIIIKPNMVTTFAWDVNINECTINDLKNIITVSYPEMPVEPENARVVIFVDKESRTMLDDTHLRTTLKVFVKSGIKKFAVILQTMAKAYEKWTAIEVLHDLLHLDFDNLYSLDKLDMESLLSNIPGKIKPPFLDETAKKAFIENLRDISGALFGHITINEATGRLFINPIIVKAVSMLQTIYPTMFLAVEQVFNGSRGFGLLDYVVFFQTYAILITEAKCHAIGEGLTQNLVQLHTASEKFKLKHKRDNSPVLSAVYGIVTTGATWIFVRWEGSPENPSVQVSNPYTCTFNGAMENEINVLDIIIAILAHQAAELDVPLQAAELEYQTNEEGRESQRCRLNAERVEVEIGDDDDLIVN